MVLVMNWSYLNYAACQKILKKHDKVTGLLLRSPYLHNVTQQPFYSTELMTSLVKQMEEGYEVVLAEIDAARSSDTEVNDIGGGVDHRLIPLPTTVGVAMDEDVLKRTEGEARADPAPFAAESCRFRGCRPPA
jgi:hypothetical protein